MKKSGVQYEPPFISPAPYMVSDMITCRFWDMKDPDEKPETVTVSALAAREGSSYLWKKIPIIESKIFRFIENL